MCLHVNCACSLVASKWHRVGNFVTSQKHWSCRFADKGGQGEYYGKSDVILCITGSRSALVSKVSLTKVCMRKKQEEDDEISDLFLNPLVYS